MALSFDLRVRCTPLSLDSGRITVTLRGESGARARLVIDAPREVKVQKVLAPSRRRT
jgi:hypothetical protein